jgi:hypothetical protein
VQLSRLQVNFFWIPSQSPAQEWSACALSSVADPDPNPDPYGMFLGLLDPDPDPLARGLDPDPSILLSKQK